MEDDKWIGSGEVSSFLGKPFTVTGGSGGGKSVDGRASDRQVAGTHYVGKSIQPWDYIAANQLGYFEGNVVKYVSRWKDKGGVEDLRKAAHYLQKLIELNS